MEQTKKRKKIKLKKFLELSEEEILKRAQEIQKKNKQPLEKMPISSPENARAYLVECGYDALPPAKPNF